MLFSKVLFVALWISCYMATFSNSANLLTSYLPVAMQALAYYLDMLQYEPTFSTTSEPPFSAPDEVSAPSTIKPITTTTHTSGWVQPSNWGISSPTTTTAKPLTTPRHKPGLYAPENMQQQKIHFYTSENLYFDDVGSTNPERFNPLPFSLLRDIQTETDHDDFNNDVESLDNFLRLYDDNYGRAVFDNEASVDRWSSTSTAGKKRVPPTKPYVEFLLLYDLLKRDAKSADLSKYEGYSDELLKDLYELSNASAARQLYTILKRMLERGDVQRRDVILRVQDIVKDLGNPNSKTAISLRFIPALTFLP